VSQADLTRMNGWWQPMHCHNSSRACGRESPPNAAAMPGATRWTPFELQLSRGHCSFLVLGISDRGILTSPNTQHTEGPGAAVVSGGRNRPDARGPDARLRQPQSPVGGKVSIRLDWTCRALCRGRVGRRNLTHGFAKESTREISSELGGPPLPRSIYFLLSVRFPGDRHGACHRLWSQANDGIIVPKALKIGYVEARFRDCSLEVFAFGVATHGTF
jgi:hypothetical protein